jgi:hypothetical protein
MSIEELGSVAGVSPRKRQKMCLDPSKEDAAYASISLLSRKSSKKDEEGILQWPRRKSSFKRGIVKRVIPKHLIPDVDGILVSDDEDDSKEVTCSSNKRQFQHHALHNVVAHQSIAWVMPQPYFGLPLPLPPNLPSVPAGFKFTTALIR